MLELFKQKRATDVFWEVNLFFTKTCNKHSSLQRRNFYSFFWK